ncbi:efflux RND transporter periplasmic adaptor subunit [Gallaecimonas pentaromativorans]|uniref:Membrane fusion protein (Multidrug efflux system) n=1 Tax=Gallaecimonas pentaromativorans TaxID=584787 RepID=A0A3N1PPQ7_9GAMM|nr:efflux RND transporter periplasmic adaptor subunit [Gallaecimonas pentaromativorans]ROQ29968.1 membrane fusion protein (multidrug efflux system) [Gallaecimonas pentaromativorans]
MRQHKSAILALVITAALAGCSPAEQAGQGQQQPPQEVGIMTVQSQPLTLTTELPGRVQAFLEAQIRPQVSGVLLKRLFTEGGNVDAGQSLYQIDPAPYEAALASAEASLAKANADARSTELTYKRYQKLVKTNYVSQQDLDQAEATYKQALASIKEAEAQVKTAKINLNYTDVKSPISGRIGISAVTAGALVTANQTQELVRVQQLDPIYVDLTQSSAAIQALRTKMAQGNLKQSEGAEVSVTLEDGSTYPIKGKIEYSEVYVNESTGSVTLRAVIPNPDGTLLPGMYVRAEVSTGEDSNAILVPQKGVSRDAKGNASVMVVSSDNKVEVRPVTTGEAVGNQWRITSGLKVGDKVILDGLQKVRPGAPVTTVDASKQQ